MLRKQPYSIEILHSSKRHPNVTVTSADDVNDALATSCYMRPRSRTHSENIGCKATYKNDFHPYSKSSTPLSLYSNDNLHSARFYARDKEMSNKNRSGTAGSMRSSSPSSSIGDVANAADITVAKINYKITSTKEKLQKLLVESEQEFEEMLKIMGKNAEQPNDSTSENPQIARMRQHFEKKNKKFKQEREALERRLAELEAKKHKAEHNDNANLSGNMLTSVGQNLKAITGTFVDYTGNIVGTSKDLLTGRMIKKQFGSADNIHQNDENKVNTDRPIVANAQASPAHKGHKRTGSSTFYTATMLNNPPSAEKPRPSGSEHGSQTGKTTIQTTSSKPKTLPNNQFRPTATQNTLTSLQTHNATLQINQQFKRLFDELQTIRQKQDDMQNHIDAINIKLSEDITELHNALHVERFRIQKIETRLEDLSDLNEASVHNMRHEMTTVANRMEYSHMDERRDMKELLERTNNKVTLLEQRFDQSPTDVPSIWHNLSLHFANVLVEIIKLIMFLSSVIVDAIRPLVGTRNKAAVVLLSLLLIFLMCQLLPNELSTTIRTSISRLNPFKRNR